MRCIVVCQPYASAIIKGIKNVENRTLNIPTGPLAIMAGKSTAWLGDVTPQQKEWLQPLLPWENLPYGKILGWVEVVGVLDMNWSLKDNPWAFGPVCWMLEENHELKTPVPYRGRQRLFDVPVSILRRDYVG
jgi:hypothetical protein